MDPNRGTFIYKGNNWIQINQSFPCENQNKLVCKAFGNDLIIVPSVDNGFGCTGVFNANTMEWKRLEVDQRIAPYNGQ